MRFVGSHLPGWAWVRWSDWRDAVMLAMTQRFARNAVRTAAVVMTGLVLVTAQVSAVSTSQEELSEVRRSPPNLDRGAELFRACAACHGSRGEGTVDGQVPRIAGQHASVLQKQLVDYRYDHRWDPRMEGVTGRHHLDAQAIADVTAYVSGLDWHAVNGVGNGSLVTQGRATYASLCETCHGRDARGDAARLIPRLAGQNYEYLRRQIHDAVDGRRPNFPVAHIRLLGRLEYDDIAAVSDYLSRLDVEHGSRAAE
jgi:cytochrome c553